VSQFVNLLLSGAVSGGIYAVMAAGLVLTYQTSGMFNFAHGAVAFVTAYFFYQLNFGQDVPVWLAAIVSVFVFAPLLGLALDRILLRRLATAPVYARIVGTIGLLIALPAIAIWLVETVGNKIADLDLPVNTGSGTGGGAVRGLGPSPREAWHLDWFGLKGVILNTDQVAVFVGAAIAATALWFVLRKTRLGLEMRAVVDREDLAGLRGVNSARTSSAAWVLTMILAGFGGILIAPLFQLSDSAFTLIVLGSLAAVALGGLRSIPIAFLGGLLLGILQNLVYGYGDDFLPSAISELSGLRSSIPFILTVALLFVIGRKHVAEARTVAEDQPAPDHREGLPRWRRLLPWAIGIFLLVGFTLQWFPWDWAQADEFDAFGVLAPGMAFAIVFLSFNIVTGLGGMVSLAQASFVTAGGFMAGWALQNDWGIDIPFVATHGHMNFAVAAILGSLVAAALGALIAIPVRRLGVLPLALASLALALALDLTVFQTEEVSNGSIGWLYPFPTLDLGFTTLDFANPRTQIIVLLAIFGVLTLVIHNLQNSSSGRAALALRSSQVAARTSGVVPWKSEIGIFALSAGVAGFGGVMLGMTNGNYANTTATPIAGLLWLAIVVTFGIRRPGGALLGGLAVTATTPILAWIAGWSFMPDWFNDLTGSSQFLAIMFGLGAINLAKNPDGLFALFGHQQLERRRRKRDADIASAETRLHTDSDGTLHIVDEPVAVSAVATGEHGALEPEPRWGTTGERGLELVGIVAGYGDVEVIHGLDLILPKGSIVALLGANGAGKSTLCGVTAGLLTPSAGKILINDRDVTAMNSYERARSGILLAPEARGIFPSLTVAENLEVLLRSSSDRDQAYERFRVLGERRNQSAGLLSGGEQQMLSLAPALVRPPEVFIADEPTLGLAPLAAAEVMRTILELKEHGTTILLVEEKAHEVMMVADAIAFMSLGRIVWVGPREQIDEQQLTAIYLGGSIEEQSTPASGRTARLS
jgi:ABC-type branched-subunit amino acid transport system ATPase component/branched-subunit amino acid ABC-type transport system permease component